MSEDFKLDVCLTGFGAFCGVPENPTTILMRELPAYLAVALDDPAIRITSFTVLETSRDCIPTLLALQHSSSATRRVYLHLGVAARNATFALEDRAYNDASFRVPDESGWQPQSVCIGDQNGLTFHHRTRFDLEHVCGALQARGHEACVSQSAGRFICNFVYYHSLQKCMQLQATNISIDAASCPAALFVHVPSFETVPQDAQMRFVCDLLRALKVAPLAAVPPPAAAVSDETVAAAKLAAE